MRVCLDCRCVFPGMGGIGRATAALARALPAQLGHGDTLLLLTGARQPEPEALTPEGPGCAVEVLPTDAAMIDPVFEQLHLPALLREHAVDVLHTTCFTTPVAAHEVGRVATVHDVVFRRLPELVDPALGAYLAHWSEVSTRVADRVVTVSRFSSAELLATSDEDLRPGLARRVRIVPNAVDERFFQVERDPALDEPFLLYVGALEQKKNVPALLCGFARLLARRPELPHRLVLAGGSGGQAFDLAAAMRAADLDPERVLVLGHVPDAHLLELLRRAAGFVYLSEYEGFGLPPLEALASGVPTLVADRASLPEVVGTAALVVDPADHEQVALALERLLEDADYRAACAANGPAQARRFAWDEAARLLVRVYGEARLAATSRREGSSVSPAAPPAPLQLAGGGLGDQLTFLAAAHALARSRGQPVRVAAPAELLALWPEGSFAPHPMGGGEPRVLVDASHRHRVKGRSADGNYLGTYLSALGLAPTAPPRLSLPHVPPPPGLTPGAYVVVQPLAFSAANPPDPLRWVERLIEAVRRQLPGWPVVAVGDPRTTIRSIRGLDLSHLGSAVDLIRLVAHAGLVLTPRSATAHVAAGYGVPTFVWVPGDGEDWHLDYPLWPHTRVALDASLDTAAEQLERVAEDVRRGVTTRGSTVALALERAGLPELRPFLGTGAPCPPGLLGCGGAASPAEAVRSAVELHTGRSAARYLPYLHTGNAAEFVRAEALALCRGRGVDVGAGDHPLPGAAPVRDEPGRDAYTLEGEADESLDYVFSSHCLEHLEHPERALRTWNGKLRPGGVLWLYLPHPDMEEWRPGSPCVPEHRWLPTPEAVRALVEAAGFEVLCSTEVPDAYWSFRCVARRPERGPQDVSFDAPLVEASS